MWGGSLSDFVVPSGLSWKCIRCGRCCGDTEEHVRRILLTPLEAGRIASITGLEICRFLRRTRNKPYEYEMRKVHSKCFFYNGRCTIYRARPLVCRFYPFVLERFGEKVVVKLGDRSCPGVGRGPRRSRRFFIHLISMASDILE